MLKDEIFVREVNVNDAQSLIVLIPKLDEETDYMNRIAGEFKFSQEDEEKFILSLKNDRYSTLFIALCEDKMVGSLGFSGSQLEKYRHTGEFGMGVLKDYWGKGIGKELIRKLFEWAIANDIKKINLKVMTSNTRALNLYEGFGFEIEGRIKKGMKIRGEYHDIIIMGKTF